MKIQDNPHSLRIREIVESELFSLMLDVSAAYDGLGYRAYCAIVLARHACLPRAQAMKIVIAEIQRRQPGSARTWTVSQGSVGGAI